MHKHDVCIQPADICNNIAVKHTICMMSKFQLEALSHCESRIEVPDFPKRRQYKPSLVWHSQLFAWVLMSTAVVFDIKAGWTKLLSSQHDILIWILLYDALMLPIWRIDCFQSEHLFPFSLSLSLKLFLMDPNWTLAPPKVIISDIHK